MKRCCEVDEIEIGVWGSIFSVPIVLLVLDTLFLDSHMSVESVCEK